MQTALDAFEAAMLRVRSLHGLHASLSNQLTAAIDLSDILRAEIVLAVSAFDFFIHELTRLGMLECHQNSRPQTSAFKRFPIPIETAMGLTEQLLDTTIRQKHGYLSFQSPEKVADAIRLFSEIDLWNDLAIELGEQKKPLKNKLILIIERRNKIAHQADIDPTFPDLRWPIDRSQVEYSCDILEKLARAIFKVSV